MRRPRIGILGLCFAQFFAIAATCAGGAAEQSNEPAAPADTHAKPAWVSRELQWWPQILLSHDARFRPDESLAGASGFLCRLPNQAIVAVTARHLLGKKKPLADVDASIISWTMSPRTVPQRRIVIDKLALKIDQMGELDCLLLGVRPQRTWPAEVLDARTTPAQAGETIYLIGVPYSEENVAQNIYRGTVLSREGTHDFSYRVDGKPDTRGFSGAPILDAEGRAVGIHLGRYNMNDGSTALRAMDMSAAVEVADAPAPPASPAPPAPKVAATVEPTPAAPKPKPATRPTTAADDNTKASGLLSLAKNYIAAAQFEKARDRLKTLVETYPAAPAATEAKRLLEEITGK